MFQLGHFRYGSQHIRTYSILNILCLHVQSVWGIYKAYLILPLASIRFYVGQWTKLANLFSTQSFLLYFFASTLLPSNTWQDHCILDRPRGLLP
jgi:hypothetical protein